MHSPLTPHKHADCLEQIMALNNCHFNHPVKKYFGVCNTLKTELNACFALEREVTRMENFNKARAARDKREELWKEFEDK